MVAVNAVVLNVAVIVTVRGAGTTVVMIEKVTEFLVGLTATAAGATTASSDEVRAIEAPPEGAVPLMVMVPVKVAPPTTVDWLMVNCESWSRLINIGATLLAPERIAVKLAVVPTVAEAEPLSWKTTELWPASTVAVPGMETALLLLLESVTTKPPVGAGPVNRMRTGVEPPAVTVIGLGTMSRRTGGLTRTEVERFLPLYDAEIVAKVETVTAEVVNRNEPLRDPAAMVTVAGAATTAVSLVILTTTPPAGAGPLRRMIPVAVKPPVRAEGFGLTL